MEQLQKLPALYLLDSIIKNVGREYLNLIAQIIDSVFTAVFEKVPPFLNSNSISIIPYKYLP